MTGIMCAMFVGGGFDGTYSGTAGSGAGYTGFSLSVSFGTISPTTFVTGNDGIILELDWNGTLYFGVNGISPNSGWSTVTINGNVFNRASASYSTPGGSTTYWQWASVSNPFTNGSPYTAVFA